MNSAKEEYEIQQEAMLQAASTLNANSAEIASLKQEIQRLKSDKETLQHAKAQLEQAAIRDNAALNAALDRRYQAGRESVLTSMNDKYDGTVRSIAREFAGLEIKIEKKFKVALEMAQSEARRFKADIGQLKLDNEELERTHSLEIAAVRAEMEPALNAEVQNLQMQLNLAREQIDEAVTGKIGELTAAVVDIKIASTDLHVAKEAFDTKSTKITKLVKELHEDNVKAINEAVVAHRQMDEIRDGAAESLQQSLVDVNKKLGDLADTEDHRQRIQDGFNRNNDVVGALIDEVQQSRDFAYSVANDLSITIKSATCSCNQRSSR
jgi:hypothetical protein